MAEKLSLTRIAYGNYENCSRDPDTDTLGEIADILGCTADYLLDRTDFPAPQLTREESAILGLLREANALTRKQVEAMLRLAAEEGEK